MRYQRPKGTADTLPADTRHWQYVEASHATFSPSTGLKRSARRCLKTLKSFLGLQATPQTS